MCRAAESGINEDIVLTEVDLDNILRAKAAMFSGYTCLLDKIGLKVDDLDEDHGSSVRSSSILSMPSLLGCCLTSPETSSDSSATRL